MVLEPIALNIEEPAWHDAGLEALALRAVAATLAHLGLDPSAHEVSILGCGDDRIARLNADFRGKPSPTNVLSWPAAQLAPGETPPGELGDIAIAYQTCAREAAASGKPFADHTLHLIVHATLHLLGFDHEIDAEAEKMEELERQVLGKLGLADPYCD